MRRLQNIFLGLSALTISLFGTVGCASEKISPTPIVREYKSTNQKQIEKERVKPYLEATGYKEISANEWLSYYPNGLTVITNSEVDRKLRGRTLVPERVMVGNRYGSVKEYVNLRDAETNETYFATIDAISGITEDVDSFTEVSEKIKSNESELFASVLSDIENNKSPVPNTEKIIENENPYAVGTALHHILKDVEIIDFANGEVTPFAEYNARLNSGKLEFEVVGTPETVAIYLLMSKLGVNYTILFVEKELGMLVGDRLSESKVYETPATTRTRVRIAHQLGSNTVSVSGSFGDSVLTRVTRYTYFSIKAGKSLKAEEVPPPLKEYKFEATVDPKETLRNVGEHIAKKNREEEERQKQQEVQKHKEVEQFKAGVKEKISDVQKEAERQQEKTRQQVEELKRKAEEELKKRNEELRKQAEEQRKKLEREAEKSKERFKDIFKKKR